HGELRGVALLHGAGDVDHAAAGHQPGSDFPTGRRLEQDEFHAFPPSFLHAFFGPEYSISSVARPARPSRRAAQRCAKSNCLTARCAISWRHPTTNKLKNAQGETMAVIKVTDIAYARLRSPDLDLQAEFNENFGLVQSAK